MCAAISPFDFALIPGAQAEDALAILKKELPATTPGILGSPSRAAELVESIEPNPRSPGEIIAEAARLDLDRWLGERATELRETAWYAEHGWPPHGEWPAESFPITDLYALTSHTGSICPEVMVAILPGEDPAVAAAHLRFGGWNACPIPAVHVALARRWASSHAAVTVAATSDTLEFRVVRVITARAEAVDMAMTQYLYCPETVEQPGSIEIAAASLIGSSVWRFWWD